MIIPTLHTRRFCVHYVLNGNPAGRPLSEIVKNATDYTFAVLCSARGKSGIDNEFGNGYAEEITQAFAEGSAPNLTSPVGLSLLIWPEGAPEQMRHVLVRAETVYHTTLQPFTHPDLKVKA